MEIVQVLAKLKLNNRILERNFKYQVIKYLFGLNEIATFLIQKDYYKANEVSIKKDEKIKLELSTNGNSSISIFDGVVTDPKESENFFVIEAENNIKLKETIQETFEDVSLSEVLQKLADVDLRITTSTFKKWILNSTKKDAIKNILTTAKAVSGKEIYYYYENGKIVITENLTGKNYQVNDYTIEKKGSCLTIFPIPELTLKDTLTYMDTSYNLKSLIFENNKILCEVKAA